MDWQEIARSGQFAHWFPSVRSVRVAAMTSNQFRAVVDGRVSFANGGHIDVEGFRLDLPSAEAPEAEVQSLLVSSLGLLMADQVELRRVDVVEEQHKGTRGGPSRAAAPEASTSRRLVELNHPIRAGLVTLPGLPGPEISAHLSREDSRAVYTEGTTFEIGRISMIANTGTYLDAPHHRFDGGADLTGYTLEQLVDLPAVVVRVGGSGHRGVSAEALAAYEVEGRAVLLHTGDDARFGTPEYVVDPGFLTKGGAESLVARGAALVGIDAANIDDMTDGTRPSHTVLLAAGVPIVEHLTGLDQLPVHGALFTAAPPRVVALGTFPVRAFASVPG